MSSGFHKVLKIVSSLIVCVVILLAFLLYGVRIFGFELYTVLSPSMEPDYPTGSLLYVKNVDPRELAVNDVITFRLSGDMTGTHRIVEMVTDEKDPSTVRFRTKGDNNDMPDGSLVEIEDVVGKPIFCIPVLGYVASYIQSPSGAVVTIAIGSALILFVVLTDSITDNKTKKKMN